MIFSSKSNEYKMLDKNSGIYQQQTEIRGVSLETIIRLSQPMGKLSLLLDRYKSSILERYFLRELTLFPLELYFYVIANMHEDTIQVFGRKKSSMFYIEIDRREKVLLMELDKRNITYIRVEPTEEDIYFKRRTIIIDHHNLS